VVAWLGQEWFQMGHYNTPSYQIFYVYTSYFIALSKAYPPAT